MGSWVRWKTVLARETEHKGAGKMPIRPQAGLRAIHTAMEADLPLGRGYSEGEAA